jgi:hypothetical protein
MRDAQGRFLPGADPARHVFTPEERRRGGQSTWRRAMYDEPWLLRWLQKKIDASRARRRA